MINKKLLFLPILFFILLFFLINTGRKTKPNSKTPLNNRVFSNDTGLNGIHKVKFFDKRLFYEAINEIKDNTKPFSYHVSGGVIPHHLLANFIIADFFNQLSFQKPTTIILIGPNHYEKGNFKALTSLYGWDTSFGVVTPNTSIINNLIENNLVKVDEETLSNDHALSGIMPFIKYYLPDAKVVPILLSNWLGRDESEILANNLKTFMNKDTVLIASVDFSHYLTSNQAKEKDKITLQIIKNFDYRQLFLLNSDYLDSRPSIYILLTLMQKLKTTNMDLLYNTNSGELQKNEFIQTTSYFSLTYH